MTALALVALLAQGPAAAASVVFTGVNVVSMETNDVRRAQTVIVRGDRIVAAEGDGRTAIPADAVHIDGRGGYLVPGLIDAHVHLQDLPWAHSRDNFGDAPLYLAHGITTVINLGGSARELDWRRRVASGELPGPTIYTSGPFLNEPLVRTPEEVERAVNAQAADGFDLIKFHELPDTTVGLSRASYARMIDAAHRAKMPLVGHAPVNLSADDWLAARQPLAHAGIPMIAYFRPILGNERLLMLSAGLIVLLTILAIAQRTRHVVFAALVAWLAAAILFVVLPAGPLDDSVALRVVATAIPLALCAIAARMKISVSLVTTVAFTLMLALFWIPVAWRSTDAGIAKFAARARDAGISVQSTLVVYELFDTIGSAALREDEAIAYLVPQSRDAWRRQPPTAIPAARVGEFNRKVVAALHREGVPILAGTDAMGIPLVPPGTSLHRELALLRACGLTPYDVLRAATVAAARFLGKEHEFGMITAGKRADLVLVDANPLEDLGTLKSPVGVMVRGKWLPRHELQQMLAALRDGS